MQDELSSDVGRLILRLMTAGLLLFHGISKVIHGVDWMDGPLNAHHLPIFLKYGVYVAEVGAPVFLILGIYTRLAALVVAFDLFMAFYLVAWHGFSQVNRGGGWGSEVEAFFFLSAAAIFFLGPGRFRVRTGSHWWQ